MEDLLKAKKAIKTHLHWLTYIRSNEINYMFEDEYVIDPKDAYSFASNDMFMFELIGCEIAHNDIYETVRVMKQNKEPLTKESFKKRYHEIRQFHYDCYLTQK
jgi:hypothetical protein